MNPIIEIIQKDLKTQLDGAVVKAESEVEEYRKAYNLKESFDKFVYEQEEEDGNV